MGEEIMGTVAGQTHNCCRKVCGMFVKELFQALLTAVPQIHIEDHDPGHSPSRNTDVGVRPSAPPLADRGFVRGGSVKPVEVPGMFPDAGTGDVSTGALAIHQAYLFLLGLQV